ncbi:MAG: type I-E CRISPR-associated protein Cas6/Cse3/CasE [Pseudomonadota bacterium]
MADPLYLSRLRLRHDAPADQLVAAALGSRRMGEVMDAQHRLLWTVFGDRSDRTRDWLWRGADDAKFFTLSRRAPDPHSAIFDVETRRFEPDLETGDRLSFQLRVNATRNDPNVKASNGKRSKRFDIAQKVINETPQELRAQQRHAIAEQAALDWICARSEASGFRLIEHTPEKRHEEPQEEPQEERRERSARLDAYHVIRIPRRRSAQRAVFGVFDLEGLIEVTDPGVFVDTLAQGFGRAKAFGCGLMLIRRAP